MLQIGKDPEDDKICTIALFSAKARRDDYICMKSTIIVLTSSQKRMPALRGVAHVGKFQDRPANRVDLISFLCGWDGYCPIAPVAPNTSIRFVILFSFGYFQMELSL